MLLLETASTSNVLEVEIYRYFVQVFVWISIYWDLLRKDQHHNHHGHEEEEGDDVEAKLRAIFLHRFFNFFFCVLKKTNFKGPSMTFKV